MRRPLLAGLALILTAVAAPPAAAGPFFHYRGGCGVTLANDATPGGFAGGASVWNGAADIIVVATNHSLGTPAPTATLVVRCDLVINGNPFNIAFGSGTGVALAAFPHSIPIPPGAWVDLCETVWVQGEKHFTCYNVTTAQPVPQPVYDTVSTTLITLDPTSCLLLGALAPGLPPTVDVHPWGDVRVLGNPVYDCPPYSPAPKVEPQYLMYERHF